MSYYIVLILAITTLYALTQILSFRDEKRAFLVLAFSIIGIMVGFRGINVGADTWNYYQSFGQYANTTIFLDRIGSADTEIGYVALTKVLYGITENPQILFIFEGILIAVSYSVFFSHNTENIGEAYTAVLAYLAFNMFSFQLTGLRQSIAMACAIWSYEQAKKQRIIPFLAIVMASSLFHASALFLLPSFFLIRIENKRKLKVGLIAVGVYFILNLNTITTWTYSISDRFSKYGIERTDNGLVFFTIMAVILFLGEFAANNTYDESLQQASKQNYINFILWCARLVSRTIERVSLFYMPMTAILTSKLYRGVARSSNRIFVFSLNALLVLLFLYRMRATQYSFFW